MTSDRSGAIPIVVFTDGACSGNPGTGGWAAVVAIPELAKVWELGGGARATTNNRMEIMGALEALRALRDIEGPIHLYTDSTYVIKGITQWIWAWRKRGWKTAEGKEVTNQDLWEALFSQAASRRDRGGIEWLYVRGHTGVPGNERADEISVAFAKGYRTELYSGPLLRYPVAVLDLPEHEEVPERTGPAGGKEEKQAAHSYLSLVNGECRRHAAWTDCERAVKGRSGAKFKKTRDATDEAKILAEWRVTRVKED